MGKHKKGAAPNIDTPPSATPYAMTLKRGDVVKYHGRTGTIMDMRFSVDYMGNAHPDLLLEFTDFLRAWTGTMTWQDAEKIGGQNESNTKST